MSVQAVCKTGATQEKGKPVFRCGLGRAERKQLLSSLQAVLACSLSLYWLTSNQTNLSCLCSSIEQVLSCWSMFPGPATLNDDILASSCLDSAC